MVKKGSHDGRKEGKEKHKKKTLSKGLFFSSFAPFVHQFFSFFSFWPPFFSSFAPFLFSQKKWRFLVSTRCLHQQFTECRLQIRHRIYTTSTEFRHSKGHLPKSDLKPTDIRQHDFINSTQNIDTKIPMRKTTERVNDDVVNGAVSQTLVVIGHLRTSASPAKTVSWNIRPTIERSYDEKKKKSRPKNSDRIFSFASSFLIMCLLFSIKTTFFIRRVPF